MRKPQVHQPLLSMGMQRPASRWAQRQALPSAGLPASSPSRLQLPALLLGLLLQFPAALFAQGPPSPQTPPALDWQLDATVAGVDFYHTLADCQGEKVVFLKFNNRTGKRVQVSWREALGVRQQPGTVEGMKGIRKLVLEPGETAETSCRPARCHDCLIRPDQVHPAYRADITSFAYSHIVVGRAP